MLKRKRIKGYTTDLVIEFFSSEIKLLNADCRDLEFPSSKTELRIMTS